MIKEQFRKTRFVRITRGRIAIFINPFRVLCAERVVYLALKLGVTRNFGDEDGRMRCVHRLAPDVLALWKRIEDAIPTAAEIKDRHVQYKHRIVSPPSPSPFRPSPWRCDIGLFEVCRFHLCVSLQW
jgi:hypothetical protein